MRALELYAGIGGFATALDAWPEHTVAMAIELSEPALRVYRANHPHPTQAKNIAGLKPADLEHLEADLWWLSPPCQSFTTRGSQRDLEDTRARSFLHALSLIEALRPPLIALENVPGFSGSRAHALLHQVLGRAGYTARERVCCPTELGVPNRRARYYLVAAREPGALAPEAPARGRNPVLQPLGAYLDPHAREDQSLNVDPALAERYLGAMEVLDPDRDGACATCFTSAYGRSPVRSGSYLVSGPGIRRFSPREIARLLGFPDTFVLPEEVPRSRLYGLLGNSLSIPAVREVLSGFTALSYGLTSSALAAFAGGDGDADPL